MSVRFLDFAMKMLKFSFGNFEKEEFKKFLRIGCVFSVIVGVYWTLRALKDSIFIQLVDKMQIPYAKTISLICLFPIVVVYTKILEKTSREKMFVFLPAFYSLCVFVFAVFMYFAQGEPFEISSRSSVGLVLTKLLGYMWYFFVESFGSLFMSLFWAFAADTTKPSSARRGFPLVAALGQLGGSFCPFTIATIPHRFHLKNDALSISILGILILIVIPLFKNFIKKTPSNLLQSFHTNHVNEHKKEPGFFEGLKLLFDNKYLLGIFFIVFVYEFIVTIFDFNFKLKAGTLYTGAELTRYLSIYASSVNIVSLLCLVLGISNITKFFGTRVSLIVMPIIALFFFIGFAYFNSLAFLFGLMIGTKAINYALNMPNLRQLYIPTTKNVRFKTQAWIETFGARTSKEIGSIFNMSLHPLQVWFGVLAGKTYYLACSACIGVPFILCWFFISLALGRKFQKAVDTKNFIC